MSGTLVCVLHNSCRRRRSRRSPYSGPVAIASGKSAAMIDSLSVPGVFEPPENDDSKVADRGSNRGPTGGKVDTVWEYLTNDIKGNTYLFVTCQHCMSTMSTRK
jgi:hypothetical protein